MTSYSNQQTMSVRLLGGPHDGQTVVVTAEKCPGAGDLFPKNRFIYRSGGGQTPTWHHQSTSYLGPEVFSYERTSIMNAGWAYVYIDTRDVSNAAEVYPEFHKFIISAVKRWSDRKFFTRSELVMEDMYHHEDYRKGLVNALKKTFALDLFTAVREQQLIVLEIHEPTWRRVNSAGWSRIVEMSALVLPQRATT